MTHLSPALERIESYPFEALDRRKADAPRDGRRDESSRPRDAAEAGLCTGPTFR